MARVDARADGAVRRRQDAPVGPVDLDQRVVELELGAHRAAADQRADVVAGAARLRELLGDLVQPIFTPPWNRCTVTTGRCLVELGFRVLSREWRAEPLGLSGLSEVPIRVDWLKPELPARLSEAIRDGGRVGVMFHHAVMDADDIARADELLALLARHERARAGAILAPHTVQGR